MDSDAFMFDRDAETMPRAALAELQSVRLRQTPMTPDRVKKALA